MITGLNEAKKNIRSIEERRIVATIALCEYYAGVAQQTFRERQIANAFWTNRTGVAYNEVFADNFKEGLEIGFFLAHAVEYGVYLELANDRKHESLRPIMFELLPRFEADLRRIWT